MPKLSNPNKKQLLKMLDRKWSAFIRAHGKCEYCGTTENLTDSHIIGRGYFKTRFDPRNNQCICFSDHGKLEAQPIAFARWVETTSCGQYVDTMIIQANAGTKPDYDLWAKILEIIEDRNMNLEQAREWLGNHILLNEFDIMMLV